jgi:hypothetical protein
MVSLKASIRSCGLFVLAALAAACSSEGNPGPRVDSPIDGEDNPNAMPCPPLNSGYEGDERCILPPDPAKGLQLHVGPTDYTDQAQLAEFELLPGKEVTQCYYMRAPNTETLNFFEQHYRMRKGSHHLILHMGTGEAAANHAEGWAACESAGFTPIGGTQQGIAEFPVDGVLAPEDANLFRPLLPGSMLKFELHFINSTTKPALREAWVNFIKKDLGPDAQILGGVFMVGGTSMRIEPFSKQTLKYRSSLATEPKRVVSLYGHRHAHTVRFSIWANRGGVVEQIYEDYDWKEPTELSYNSVLVNKPPDPVGRKAGGASGILNFEVGDSLEWECEIDNDSEHVLTFRNEVYTGEMCNVFGSSVGATPFWSGRATALQ